MAILSGGRGRLDSKDVIAALRLNEEWSQRTQSEAPLEQDRCRDAAPVRPKSKEEFERRERDELFEALVAQRWNISATARELGLSRGSLRSRMRRLGLSNESSGGS